MNYQIIKDEEKLTEFVNSLPDCQEGEKYFIQLFARKKYDKTGVLKSDRAQLKRIACNKEHIVTQIKSMEIADGLYSSGDVVVPKESLALYIGANPRSLRKANFKLLKELANKLSDNYNTFNPKSLALNCIQTSVDNATYYDVDFDLQGVESVPIIHDLKTHLKTTNFRVIMTRDGFHLLINMDDNMDKYWYQTIIKRKEFIGIDVMMSGKDSVVPVPGCVQGDFVPYEYKF